MIYRFISSDMLNKLYQIHILDMLVFILISFNIRYSFIWGKYRKDYTTSFEYWLISGMLSGFILLLFRLFKNYINYIFLTIVVITIINLVVLLIKKIY